MSMSAFDCGVCGKVHRFFYEAENCDHSGTPAASRSSGATGERPTFRTRDRLCDNCGKGLLAHEDQRYCPASGGADAPTVSEEEIMRALHLWEPRRAPVLRERHLMQNVLADFLAARVSGSSREGER